mmetsp:Transcript_48606/g.62400  ORF Transcript_48606/g.62400 Transcript_48606/m.62400 type:complete len:275 (+) Transcript_48606:307-1131(+)
MVIQERSHSLHLGSFYKNYFCDLIEKGELPYLSKESCGEYGSQRRKVFGLSKLGTIYHQYNKTPPKCAPSTAASQTELLQATREPSCRTEEEEEGGGGGGGKASSNMRNLQVKVTAPDGESSLRDQMMDYIDAKVLVLGHGGGMVYSLFLNEELQGEGLQEEEQEEEEEVGESSTTTVIEITPPAKHMENNGAAKGLVTLAHARKQHFIVRRIVCYDGGAFVINLLDSFEVRTSQENYPLSQLKPFSGDVSDVNTPCGSLVHHEINQALEKIRI